MKTRVLLWSEERWQEDRRLLLTEEQVKLIKWLATEGLLDDNWRIRVMGDEEELWEEI